MENSGIIIMSPAPFDSGTNFSERLIGLVKHQPILYRKLHGPHKNTAAKGRIWARIAKQLGSTEEICERRWRSLRERYSRELKKWNTPCSSGAQNDIQQQWEFWEDMSFLKEYIQPRNSKTNKRTPSLSPSLQQSTLDDSAIDEEMDSNSSQRLVSESRKRKTSSHYHLKEKMNTMIDTLTDYLEQKPTEDHPNTQDHFGQVVSAIISGFRPDKRIQAKADILACLADIQRSELDEPIRKG